MARVKKSIRFPVIIIKLLRDLRDSYTEPRPPVPELINRCLRITRVVPVLKLAPTTRKTSEAIQVTLADEFKDLPSPEIAARVAHALIGIQSKLIPEQIALNRT